MSTANPYHSMEVSLPRDLFHRALLGDRKALYVIDRLVKEGDRQMDWSMYVSSQRRR